MIIGKSKFCNQWRILPKQTAPIMERFKEKRKSKFLYVPCVLKGNAPVHTAQVAVSAAQDYGFRNSPPTPSAYSPDLAPSCFN